MEINTTAFSKNGHWYKGNLHTHTNLSDGTLSPEQVIELYKKSGYSFLAITDHNLFNAYPQFSTGTFLLISGTELTPGFDKEDRVLMEAMESFKNDTFSLAHASPELKQKLETLACPHVVAISRTDSPEAWKADITSFKTIQSMLDYARRKNCLSIVAHPAWSKLDTRELFEAEGFTALEVYNHASSPWEDSSVYWNSLLGQGKKVFADASDDMHDMEFACGGYIMLKAESLSYHTVIDALENGEYYSSTGPEIVDFQIMNNKAYVKCSGVKQIRFIPDTIFGHSYMAKEGSLQTECEHKLLGNESFLRIEVMDLYGKKAWSNPVFLDR